MTKKREYYETCVRINQQDPNWITRVLAHDKAEPFLLPLHRALIRLAVRNTAR